MDTRPIPSRRARRYRAHRAFPIWLLFAIPLFIGLAHLAAHGGGFAIGPFLWFPFLFFWVAGRGFGRRHRHRDELEETSRLEAAEHDRLRHVEVQLVEARQQIKDLQDQLAWHVKLLAAQQPAPTPSKEVQSPPREIA